MKRKPRELKPDEIEIWRRVADATTRMHTKPLREVQRPVPKKTQIQNHTNIPHFHIGDSTISPRVTHSQKMPVTEHLRSLTPVMDRKTFNKMNRGKLKPEARIDLHGMTLAQAHPSLNRFITSNFLNGARLVLVITGKGRSKEAEIFSFEQKGVLRNQVPHWLTTPPLREMVLEIRPAHLRHGGDGAYYVYLRRQR